MVLVCVNIFHVYSSGGATAFGLIMETLENIENLILDYIM